jgi:AcrR family transcriptional regulator
VSPRPRRAQHDVLEATLDVIAEQGVMGASVDTVAARTGVSKATIYRHWGSRARLLYAAISSLQPESVEPDTGTLRGDLMVLLHHLVDYFDTPTVARVFPSLLDASVRDPELAALRQETLRLGRASFERVIHLAVDRGELPTDVDVRLVVDLTRAPVIYRRVVAQTAVAESELVAIVDAVLMAFRSVTTSR